jgi:hypothetical protein
LWDAGTEATPRGPAGAKAGAKAEAKVGAAPVAVRVEEAGKPEPEYMSSGRGWTNASTARTRDWTGSKSAWTGSSRAAKAVEPGGLIRGRPLSRPEED